MRNKKAPEPKRFNVLLHNKDHTMNLGPFEVVDCHLDGIDCFLDFDASGRAAPDIRVVRNEANGLWYRWQDSGDTPFNYLDPGFESVQITTDK